MSDSPKVEGTATAALGSVEQFAAKKKVEVDKPKNPKVVVAPDLGSANPMRFAPEEFLQSKSRYSFDSERKYSVSRKGTVIFGGVAGVLCGLAIIFAFSGGAMRDRYIQDLKSPLLLLDQDAEQVSVEADRSYQVEPPSESDPISNILPPDQLPDEKVQELDAGIISPTDEMPTLLPDESEGVAPDEEGASNDP